MLYTVRQHKNCARLGLRKEIGRHRNASEIYLTLVQRTICCRQFVVGFYFIKNNSYSCESSSTQNCFIRYKGYNCLKNYIWKRKDFQIFAFCFCLFLFSLKCNYVRVLNSMIFSVSNKFVSKRYFKTESCRIISFFVLLEVGNTFIFIHVYFFFLFIHVYFSHTNLYVMWPWKTL